MEELKEGVEVRVHTLLIHNPHHFYVRPTSLDTCVAERHKVYQHISENGAPLEMNQVQLGSTILYKREEGWIRGRVVGAAKEKEECSMYALDYGFTDYQVKLERTRALPAEHRCSPPPLAQRCQLQFCEPKDGNSWSESSIAAMIYFIARKPVTMFIKEIRNIDCVVVLFNYMDNDIAKLMIYSEDATMGGYDNEINRIGTITVRTCKREYKWRDLQCEVPMRVKLLCRTTKLPIRLYVVQVSDLTNETFKKTMINMNVKSHFHKVLAKEDTKFGNATACWDSKSGQFFRGVIMKVPSNGNIKVRDLDMGVDKYVKQDNLKEIRPESLEYPVVAIYCRLESEQEMQPSALEYLDKCSLSQLEFTIKIKRLGNKYLKPHIVTIVM